VVRGVGDIGTAGVRQLFIGGCSSACENVTGPGGQRALALLAISLGRNCVAPGQLTSRNIL